MKDVELQRLNRTLKAHNRCDRALIRATDEAEFMKEVCRIVVEDCGHALVWIGFAEEDDAQSIRPVAHYGFEEGYLETLKLTWADTERGRGPTGTAIRTGRPSTCRNMLIDPKFLPWREEALKRGYASSIVLPLLDCGKAFGAITIYSRNPDPFSEDETDLLTYLADDLAFGITSLRLREAHRRAEQALIESERRLSLAQQAGRVGVFDWDIVSGRVIWTAQLEEIFGLAPGGYEGTYEAWASRVYPEDLPRLEVFFEEWMDSERTDAEWEYRFLSLAGEVRWSAARARIVRDADGKPLRIIGTNLDITEQKRGEAQMLEQAKALAEADRRKDEFLAMLAHELRNPLAPMRYALQILGSMGPRESHLQRQREILERQVAHMANLLDDLLDVSRISRGKIRLQKEKLDLRAIVERAIEAARPQAAVHRLMLTSVRSPEPLWMEGDATRLEQILRNLIGNAIKYTPDCGRIEIAAGLEAASEDHHSMQAVVSIRDSGIGIPPELLPHIFEIFIQADQAMDRAQGGLGIGLTMVKNLVEMHGGNVRAASNGSGKGSEFTVRLPLLSDAVVSSAAPAPAVPAAGHAEEEPQQEESIKVLVVDDNVDSACSLAELLQLWGCQARVSHDGPDALKTAMEYLPEVILLDIGLPGMDGYEVARHLRQTAALEGTTLIALTGYGMEEDRRKSNEAGFDQHFTKPLDLKALRRLLQQMLTTQSKYQ